MNMTEERLDRSKCRAHETFDRECHVCIRRYYQFLIDDDYVARYLWENQRRTLATAEAMNDSYRVQVEDLQAELRAYRAARGHRGWGLA